MELSKYIRSIPDYPKKGTLFRDITTLIKNKGAFKETIDQLSKLASKIKFDKLVAVESRGFVFSSALAYNLSKSLILIRKKGKLPADTFSQDFVLEYRKATIEIHKDSINKNDSVVVIDDLIATGGTARAAAKLVEKSGGIIAGFIFVINLYDLGGIKKLHEKGYKALSLIEFPGH